MIPHCSIVSALFDLRFDSIWPKIRLCSTHGLTQFDPKIDSVWFKFLHFSFHRVWLKTSCGRLNLRQKEAAFYCFCSNQESSTSAQYTHFSAGFDPVWPMIQLCSIHNAIRFDSWFSHVSLYRENSGWFGLSFCLIVSMLNTWLDPHQLYRSCSTYDLTQLDPWFEHVRIKIRPCSILSSLFDPQFDTLGPIIRNCSTHGLTIFDP